MERAEAIRDAQVGAIIRIIKLPLYKKPKKIITQLNESIQKAY